MTSQFATNLAALPEAQLRLTTQTAQLVSLSTSFTELAETMAGMDKLDNSVAISLAGHLAPFDIRFGELLQVSLRNNDGRFAVWFRSLMGDILSTEIFISKIQTTWDAFLLTMRYFRLSPTIQGIITTLAKDMADNDPRAIGDQILELFEELDEDELLAPKPQDISGPHNINRWSPEPPAKRPHAAISSGAR